jgi:DNA polymerase-3 subunit delta'
VSGAPPVAPWHGEPWERLVQRAETGRLPHALLLDGPRGWGKRFLARQFARRLLGLAPADPARFAWGDEGADADLLTHPDARIVQRTPTRDGARLRQQITVDQVRELGEFLVRTAGQGGHRVVVLELAEELNVNAANALLKRLEEPGPRTHLLLVTHEASRVLATIRSRCQRIPLAPGSRALAARWLAGRLDPDLDAAGLLALAGDAPLRALRLAEQDALALDAEVGSVLDGADPAPLVHGAPRLDPGAQRERAALLLELAYRRLVRRARAEAGEDPLVHRQLDRVLQARRALESTANPNPALLLEDVLLGLRPRRRR